MRFYLDENISDRVASIGRSYGFDVISSHECGRDRLPDDEQLQFAAREGRCLVTRDREDFIELTVRFFENGWSHAGVLILPHSLPNKDFAGIARALLAFAAEHPGDMASYTVMYLRPA